MARTGTSVLDTNDRFPELDLNLISGETLTIPKDAGDGYAVFFTYRGFW